MINKSLLIFFIFFGSTLYVFANDTNNKFTKIYVYAESFDKRLSPYETNTLALKAKTMNKSEKFSWLLYNSSLDEEVKEFILNNLDNNTQKEKQDIYNILLNDVSNTVKVMESIQ